MKYNLKKRILAFLLTVVMLVGMVPGTAITTFAEEISSGGPAIEETSTTEQPSENSAPVLSTEAPNMVELKVGDSYDITQYFSDADGDALTYTVDCDDVVLATDVASYKYVPEQAGSFLVSVKATDGQHSTWWSVAVVVAEAERKDGTEDKPADSSAEDNGKTDASDVQTETQANSTATLADDNKITVYTCLADGKVDSRTYVYWPGGKNQYNVPYVNAVTIEGIKDGSSTYISFADTPYWDTSSAETKSVYTMMIAGGIDSVKFTAQKSKGGTTQPTALSMAVTANGAAVEVTKGGTYNVTSGISTYTYADDTWTVPLSTEAETRVVVTASCSGKSVTKTFVFIPANAPFAPELTGESTATAEIELDEQYSLDLSKVFKDKNGDDLSYKVSVDGAAAVAADESYVFTPSEAKEYTLAFTASDATATSEAYTVKLTVKPVEINAYATITIAGETKLLYKEITAKDLNNDKKVNIDEVLYAVHEEYYDGGAASGYGSYESQYGLSLGKLWGTNDGIGGYRINDVHVTTSLAEEVKEGSHVHAYTFSDTSRYSDRYSFFDRYTASVGVGSNLELTLTAANGSYDENGIPVEEKLEGAVITVNGVATTAKTNAEGKATLNFDVKGTYTVSAVYPDSTKVYVPAKYTVTVTGTTKTAPKTYVTISKAGQLQIAYEQVTANDANGNGVYDIGDALYAAHNAKFDGGTAGYETATGKYGLALVKLWGTTDGVGGYRLNDGNVATSLAEKVKADDHIHAYTYSDTTSYSDKYSFFDIKTKSVKALVEFDVVLKYQDYDSDWNLVDKPLEGATITFNGEPTDFVTDENGKATIKFAAEGSYTVSAVKDGFTIVPAFIKSTTSPANRAPKLAQEVAEKVELKTYTGIVYTQDLSKIFADADNDTLEYKVSVNGEAAVAAAKNYSYTPAQAGTTTLVFTATDGVLESEDTYIVNLTAKEGATNVVYSGTSWPYKYSYVSAITVKGPGIKKYAWSGDTCNVVLNSDTAADDVINIVLTKGGRFGAPSTTINGVSSDNSMIALSLDANGKMSIPVYAYYNKWNNGTKTLVFSIATPNREPVLADAYKDNSTVEKTVFANEEYQVDLSDKFTDADEDTTLSYKVSVDGGEFTAFTESTYIAKAPSIADEYDVVFKAFDGEGESEEIYTVKLTVKNSETTYDTAVFVPEGIEPEFFYTKEFGDDGVDVYDVNPLTAQKGETADGYTKYTVAVPENISRISFRAETLGGMTALVSDSTELYLRKVQVNAVNMGDVDVEASSVLKYGEYTVKAGENNSYLVVAGSEYHCTVTPKATSKYNAVTGSFTPETKAEPYEYKVTAEFKNVKTITYTKGATANLFTRNNYYSYNKNEPAVVIDNGDGTETGYFPGVTENASNNVFIYRVAMAGKITKAGYFNSQSNSVTVVYSENDEAPSVRPDYRSGEYTKNNKAVAEDGVLLNINARNNLVMNVGGTKNLKAYRAWEIINTHMNYIITPDFHYDIVYQSQEGVVSIADKNSPSAGGNSDWKTLKAEKTGTAIIEVSYDAVDVSGGDYSGIYGATDPARTGLMVVQVGGNDSSVNFGIDSYASQGNINYERSTPKAWDAEFDTLYFTGESGELKLSPTADSSIQRVQISADKGRSWTTLAQKDGVYTAKIAHGNNIIRVITNRGEAYQVVRGSKVSVSYKEKYGNANGIIEAGETIRITINGLHQPIPKMSGNYNPGYGGNTDGFSLTHLNYMFNGQRKSENELVGSQYEFITEANYFEVLIPKNTTEKSFTLSDGYIATGVIGVTGFANGIDGHRNIPDGGCLTRGSETTFNTRSILPEITINIGDTSAPNSAPYVKGDAITAAQIELGQNYALNPETLFKDDDGDALTFTYALNEADKGAADKTFTFTPKKTGEYIFTFTANDGKLTAQHTLTLTVVPAVQKDTEIKFDIDKSDIKGYVTVSFEDNGIREENSYGLKYPVSLGTIIDTTKVPFEEGDTIAEVTIRLLDAMGISYDYSGSITSGFYLGAIKNFVVDNTPYDKMGQFDAGEGSGWMITSNDWFIDKGASEFLVKNGDKIQWKYTCQLGSDIGDNSWENTTKEVEDLISAIGTPVTVDSIEKINAARAAYDALSEFYQSKITNYNDLLAAEKALESLIEGTATEEDKTAATNVDKLIEEIGTVTLESAGNIEAARVAYDNLTALQKNLVTKLETLETAENQLKQLNSDSHEKIYKDTGNYITNLGIPAVGSTGGEWMVIGLARGNKGLSGTVTDGYYNGVSQYINTVFSGNKVLKDTVRLHENKSTDNARVILALTAAGIDATNVNGYNLFDGLDELSYIKYQGINGPMWALIAFNAHPSYKDEYSGDVTEAKLIQAILESQLDDSGWDLSNKSADVDMTAMAIQALAPYYYTNSAVKGAVDKALAKLSSMQQKDGSFASVDGVNAESTAQVIVALTSLGIDPEEDSRFIKKGMSPVDALCNFAVSGGGFMHTPKTARDGMATEQGYYALVSYFRLLNGDKSLYDMSDVTLKTGKINPNTASAYDVAAANEVEKLISAIGKITLYSNLKIEAARDAYDKLTSLQKKLVENYDTLVNAEKKYDKLVDEAVENVEDLIDAIGEVTLESAEDITDARRAYNQLPPHVQKLVSNLDKLEKAEKELAELREEALELIRNGKLMLTKSELLKLQDEFENVTVETKYDDALKLLLTYFKLGEKQQLALAGSEQLELLKTIVAKQNHENPSTGITVYGLEWNIKVKTDKLPEKDEHIKEDIVSKLEGAQMLTIWDIYLEDVLTGERYELDEVAEVCIPVELVGDYTFYDRLGVVHYGDDGKIEVLNCKVVDGYVVFKAVDFSYYAVVGFMDVEEEFEMTTGSVVVETPEYDELIEKSEEMPNVNNSWLVWAGIAGVGVALLAVLLVLKRRMSNGV